MIPWYVISEPLQPALLILLDAYYFLKNTKKTHLRPLAKYAKKSVESERSKLV